MYESDLLLLYPLFARGTSQADWKQRWEFWNAGLSRHQLDASRLPDNVPNLETAIESVCRAYAGSAQWGCKSPSYYDQLDRLSEAFPKARFIIIWRNPADTCRSILRAAKNSSWFGKTGMLTRALAGNHELKKGGNLLQSRTCRVHQLHYAELVRDAASTMKAIKQVL